MNDTLTQYNNNIVSELQVKAKTDLTNNILEDASHYLKGSQLMELNKTLNKQFDGYEIYVEQDIDLHKDYKEENNIIVETYLSNKKLEGLSPRTLAYYKDSIERFLEYSDKHLSDVTSQDIREYLTYRQSSGKCGAIALDSIRRNLNTFFNTINNEGFIQYNPMAKIKKIKSPKKVKKPFTDWEIERMRDKLNSKPEKTPLQQYMKLRDQALFELLLSSGIRLRECTQLNKSDMDLKNRTFIVLGKGNKERVCYFSVKTQYFLDKLLNFNYRGNTIKYADEEALFVGKQKNKNGDCRLSSNAIERSTRELGESCGVKAHPHKFRRTFATNLLNKDVPIEQIKELLGHANLDTTMIYAITDQDQIKYNHKKFAG
jgi:site-specific recombinase XerD